MLKTLCCFVAQWESTEKTSGYNFVDRSLNNKQRNQHYVVVSTGAGGKYSTWLSPFRPK